MLFLYAILVSTNIRNKYTGSIVKEVIYETDYFSQGNENFSFIQ